MPISKQKLTQEERNILKSQQKKVESSRMGCFVFVVILLAILYVSGILDDGIRLSFALVGFGIFMFAFIVSSLPDITYQNDMDENQKYVGTVRVKYKERIEDDESTSVYFMITFDDWRIGRKSFTEEAWNGINVGDEFYVEQTVNSQIAFRLEHNGVNYAKGFFSTIFIGNHQSFG